MFERARVSKGNGAVERFLEFFREEGCRMVEMECKEHDKQAASSQFITHTVGRVLGMLDLPDTDINTKGCAFPLRKACRREGKVSLMRGARAGTRRC